jgi:hypothetical protein
MRLRESLRGMACIKALAAVDDIVDNGRFLFIAFMYGLPVRPGRRSSATLLTK